MTDPIQEADIVCIDAVGLLCPLPILRFKKRTSSLPAGSLVDLLTDDPTGRTDLESLCSIAGHQLIESVEQDQGVIRYRVRLA